MTKQVLWLEDILSLIQGNFSIFFNIPSSDVPEVVLALDAEKSFDRVKWGISILSNGKLWFWWLLYFLDQTVVCLSTAVLTNGVVSPTFLLQRGTRQGCLLSPLLFAIAIEPLAIWLREDVNFKGINLQGREYKLSLYADNLLLLISDPETSVPIILNILNHVGKILSKRVSCSL